MPESTLPNVLCYEELLAGQSDDFDWPEFDENTASGMCYTSEQPATRKALSTAIVQPASCSSRFLPDVTGASNMETSLPVVPMFHVNAWGPLCRINGRHEACPAGPKMADGEALTDLMNSEQVTFSSGVPTIWLALLDYLESNNLKVPSLTE